MRANKPLDPATHVALQPRLFDVAFDNSHRLTPGTFLFQYRGVSFKLVQENNGRWADHLLTILPDGTGSTRRTVFATAAEFLSAFAWENRASLAFWEAGSQSWPGRQTLRVARPAQRTLRRLAFGRARGRLDVLPLIETDEQRTALALFREAKASTNNFLSFVFFWQVMEVGRGANAEHFIDKAFAKDRSRLALSRDELSFLPTQAVGHYCQAACRNAISHIRRRPGKPTVDIDSLDDRVRITSSARAIELFAALYIRDRLQLTQRQRLTQRPRTIPTYEPMPRRQSPSRALPPTRPER